MSPRVRPPGSGRPVLVSTFFGAQHVSGVLSRLSDLAQRYVELPTAVPEGPRD
ncbi:hypothetical protein [Streptomyces sp. PTD9-10]|uniref:hypothetical protein n=1 Tax=Streptomyces sp. PTD9-10 TaxID=3120151 RepID=UPI0030092B75